MNTNNYEAIREKCINCNSKKVNDIIDLGWQPFADTFIPERFNSSIEKIYPLICSLCQKCKNIQLKYITDAFQRYNNFEYSYTSSNSNFSKEHWDNFFKDSLKIVQLDKRSNVLEIGCNDSYLLKKYKKLSSGIYGVDASKKMVDLSRKKFGLKVFHNLFDKNLVQYFLSKKIKFKLIIANNVFNHMNEPNQCLKNIYKVMEKDGKFIFEVPYWADTINNFRYDQIYHEHVTYFTVQSTYNLLKQNDFKIDDVSIEDYHGKSLRIVASKYYKNNLKNFKKIIDNEKKNGLFELGKYKKFTRKIIQNRNNLIFKILKLKKENKKIIFIGAAAKSNTFLNFHSLDNKIVDYITDTAKNKIGKLTPMSRIKIVHDDKLINEKNAFVMILIWNMKHIIENKLKKINRNLKFL